MVLLSTPDVETPSVGDRSPGNGRPTDGRPTDGRSTVPSDAARRASRALKACVFVTGFSGIVAEYLMATLASYLLGDAVLHFTLTISVMLFAMGVGSGLSKWIRNDLLETFIGLELLLSLTVAVAPPLVYTLAAYIEPIAGLLYTFAFLIGLLIGLELPLATRINESYEELRLNVSAVFEKDYYGALLGGLFFAFFALPRLGLTYTPTVLATANLVVAGLLFSTMPRRRRRSPRLLAAGVSVPCVLILLAVFAEPLETFGEQQRYRDRVIYQEQTRFQRIVMTEFRGDHWLYLDGNEQFSTFDEERYHEPLVHPAMLTAASRRRVLILGGGDGLAVREALAHPGVETITLVDLDPAMTRLARTHPVLREANRDSLDDPRVEIVHADAYRFLLGDPGIFDVAIVDLPDPKTVSLARLYSRPFYHLLQRHLSPGGVMVTQATSPFFSRRAFLSIYKTVEAAGFVAVPYHNHIPTLGEWGWVLGVRTGEAASAGGRLEPVVVRKGLESLDLDSLPTRFLNRDAMVGMLHFGKSIWRDLEEIAVSEESDLAVYYYYRSGDWFLY